MRSAHLPRELIAQRPCEPRDGARLLVVRREKGRVPEEKGDSPLFSHRIFHDFPEFLRAGDLLILNDTQVIPARLYGRKAITGGKAELLLLERLLRRPLGPPRNDERCAIYRCIGQPAKNLKPGTRLQFNGGELRAEVLSRENGERVVRFEGRGAERSLRRLGEIPLPPYIKRPVEPQDRRWYQTVYARQPGAVAAPTAGLHFTRRLLSRIKGMGVRVRSLTLHVGWGTFKPVGEEELRAGRLHPERFRIPGQTLRAIREAKAAGGRVIAVGTTVVRALETWARDPGSVPGTGKVPGTGLRNTELFIRPGFQFRAVDAVITNFHLPGTSLLLLVAAFAGEERVRAAYEEAVRRRYLFYSYGDAMLIV